MSNGSMDEGLVQSLGTSLFSGIGNVLSSASSDAGTDNDEPEEDEEREIDEGQANSEEMKEKVSDVLHSFTFFNLIIPCPLKIILLSKG